MTTPKNAPESLLTRLRYRSCGITMNDIFNGVFPSLIDDGLQVLTLCPHGFDRSRAVADSLTYRYQIPSVRLVGGMDHLLRGLDHTHSLLAAVTIVKACPVIAVILSQNEGSTYQNLIFQLNARIFRDTATALSVLTANNFKVRHTKTSIFELED